MESHAHNYRRPMMARIPVYEQRLAPGGLGISARANPAQVDQSMGRTLQNAGQALDQVAQRQFSIEEKLRREQQQTMEDRAALEAANALSKGEAYWHEQTTTRSQGWKPGDPDLRESVGKDYEKWVSETAAALPTERARIYFQTQAGSMRSRMDRGLFDLQERRTTDMLVQSTQEGMDADLQTIYRDPARRAEVVARRLAVIEAQTRIPVDKRMEIGRKYRDQANLAAESAEIERDPAGYYGRRFAKTPSTGPTGEPAAGSAVAAGGGFSAAVERVLKHEGGYNANDGNTGAPVNFGINQKANPDIDVKNLTREGAVELYRKRYWNAIGGDSLPPAIQGTALDAAVNQGPSNANKWLAESGGDVAKFNALRRAHYERLLEKPENARFRKAWMGRLESYERASGVPAGSAGPGGVIELPDAPESFRALPYEQRERLRAEAEGRMRQNTAVASQQLTNRVQDAVAMAKDGIPDPQPLTADAFAVLGDKGPAAFAEYQRSQTMAGDIASMKLARNADLAAVASGALRRAVPGEGYAAEDARDQTRAQAAAQVLKQREADPAGYVAKSVPGVTRAAQAAFAPGLTDEQRAAAVRNLATETLAAQRTLGIAEPKILSAAATDDLTRRIAKATRPEDAGLLVAALEAEYGPQYFGQVMNELMVAGKLPPALMIIPNLPNAAARETVSRLSVIKMDDLKVGVDPTLQRDAKAGAVEAAGLLARTLPPTSSTGVALLNSYQDMIERIAYERLRTGQDSNGTAAAENAAKMLLGHYQFDGQLRLPATANPRQINGALSHRLERTVVPGLTAADVPPDLTRAYRPDEALAQWRDLVATNGVWYTGQDDASVQLWVRGQNGALYRVKQGGQQVTATFDELAAVTLKQLMEPHNRGQAAQRRFREQLARETEEIRRRVEAEDAARNAQGAR
jgi:hypothetical protein